MPLYHSWQQSRQQRQTAVSQLLTTAQQSRLAIAAQLRDDLSLFREMLNQQDITRRIDAQTLQTKLRDFKQSLQIETQAFLADAANQRQLDAEALAQDLADFVAALRISVADLRQDLQLELAANAESIQQFLTDHRDYRLSMHLQTMQDLADFMEGLRSQVQTSLANSQTERQAKANELRQNLAQSRAELAADTQARFARLADFREELRQFRTGLRQNVWGNAVPLAKPNPVVAKLRSSKPTTSAVKPAKPVLKAPVSAKPSPKPASAKTAVPPKKLPVLTPPVGAFQRGQSLVVVPAPEQDAVAFEKEVYNHIHAVNGARLTEIESALEINRFQAVDALRSLIKKGLITQRDRVYLTQEPAHLS